ncbi:MAG: hypothetical protein LC667_19115 [Thioalkalivibrio sp.]|nr:hypothetical protein [Thioalkalivibrio sp.]
MNLFELDESTGRGDAPLSLELDVEVDTDVIAGDTSVVSIARLLSARGEARA